MPYFTKIIFLLLIVGNTLAAQHLSGIFQPSEADLEYVEQVDWTTFLAEDVRLNAKGFRLTNLETTGIGADRRYWGIFTESTLRDTLVKTTSWADFVQAKRSMAAAGFILSGVQAYALSETDAHYIGVWYRDETNTPHKIWKLDTPGERTGKDQRHGQPAVLPARRGSVSDARWHRQLPGHLPLLPYSNPQLCVHRQ